MRIALFLVLAGLAAGCSSESLSPGSAQAQVPLTATQAREGYHGELQSASDPTPLHFDVEFTRKADGSLVEGVGRVISADHKTIAVGPLSGADSQGSHSLTVDLRPRFGLLRLSGQTSGSGLQGTFSETTSLSNGSYRMTSADPSGPLSGWYTIHGQQEDVPFYAYPVTDPNGPIDARNLFQWFTQAASDTILANPAAGGNSVAGCISMRLFTNFQDPSDPNSNGGVLVEGTMTGGQLIYVGDDTGTDSYSSITPGL